MSIFPDDTWTVGTAAQIARSRFPDGSPVVYLATGQVEDLNP